LLSGREYEAGDLEVLRQFNEKEGTSINALHFDTLLEALKHLWTNAGHDDNNLPPLPARMPLARAP
jgi:hypothetical protein